jgi:hypothetical protein
MTDADDERVRKRAARLRILALAILSGAVTTTAVFVAVFFLALRGKPIIGRDPNGIPVLSLVGLVAGLSAVFLGLTIPARARRLAADKLAGDRARANTPTESPVARLVSAYVASAIVGLALAESAALMGLVFFLMEGHWLALVPVGLGILAMIWMFPSEGTVRGWVEDQLAELPDAPNYPPAA